MDGRNEVTVAAATSWVDSRNQLLLSDSCHNQSIESHNISSNRLAALIN